jgi:hypothetical protein
MITNGIINYNSSNLEMFDTVFRFSKLSDTIDSLDTFILSNETSVVMKKNIEVPLNTNYNFSVNFMNQFNKGTVSSSKFISSGITYYMSDSLYDGTITGNLYLINFYTPSLYTTIGSIDYNNGVINTKSVYVNNYLNSPGVVFYVTSTSKDIYGFNNNIIQIDPTTINIDVVDN